MELTMKDRLILANQYKILEKVDPDSAKTYANFHTALERGYELHYSDMLEWFEDEPLSEKECRWVLDVLDMHRSMKFSFAALSDKTGIDPEQIRFLGFDGNNESRYYAYTSYFINDLGRYDELKGSSLNSHAPMAGHYNDMLEVWKSLPDKHQLSKDELVRVSTAWRKTK